MIEREEHWSLSFRIQVNPLSSSFLRGRRRRRLLIPHVVCSLHIFICKTQGVCCGMLDNKNVHFFARRQLLATILRPCVRVAISAFFCFDGLVDRLHGLCLFSGCLFLFCPFRVLWNLRGGSFLVLWVRVVQSRMSLCGREAWAGRSEVMRRTGCLRRFIDWWGRCFSVLLCGACSCYNSKYKWELFLRGYSNKAQHTKLD